MCCICGGGTARPIQFTNRPDGIPESFDERQNSKTLNCNSFVIHDEADYDCKTSWPFIASRIFSDRLCIASGGMFNGVLSPQDLLSCYAEGGMYIGRNSEVSKAGMWTPKDACSGGGLLPAFVAMKSENRVSEFADPYTGTSKQDDVCGSHTSIPSLQFGAESAYRVSGSSISDIQAAIASGGPVGAEVDVHDDLLEYPGRYSREFGLSSHPAGIYIKDTGESNKMHFRTSVAIVGWGQEGEAKYWIVAFAWGSSWGEDGYAKIRLGTNEIDIESAIVYPKPRTPSLICNADIPSCKNGGELKADCTCWCPPGTSGPTCSDCSQKPCENGGAIVTQTCQCECQPGYFGANCEEYVLFQWMNYPGSGENHQSAVAKLSWNLDSWNVGAKFVRYANGEAASPNNNFQIAQSSTEAPSKMGEIFVDYDVNLYVAGYPKAFFMAMQIPLGVTSTSVGKGDKWIWLAPAYFNEARKCLSGGHKPPPEAKGICSESHGL
jgi:hypothetical protein